MAIETFGNNISTLVRTNPTGADAKSSADDHIRGVKGVLLDQWPNLNAPVTASDEELNFVDGVTAPIQTQLDAKGAVAGQAWTGAQNFTGATTTVATQTQGDNSTKAASTAYADSAVAVEAAARIAADALKAPLASPTFTGTVTVPTPSTSTSAVTKAYADALSVAAANVPVGGSTGQALLKNSATNYDTVWSTVTAGNSEVVLQTGNGYGSTATLIRRFTTVVTNVGTAITYADSASLGATFTINEDGLYAIHYADALGTAGNLTVSLNTASTSTVSISGAALIVYASAPAGASFATSTSRVVRLSSGDVLRCNTDLTGASNAIPFFAIRKVGV